VVFLVPDVALSAGTILAMSGDAIMMDYFACLGPIDPQVEREGKLVPVLSCLEPYDRWVVKSQQEKSEYHATLSRTKTSSWGPATPASFRTVSGTTSRSLKKRGFYT
jgi:ClpP class serine protease